MDRDRQEPNDIEQALNVRTRFAHRADRAQSAEQRIERFADLQRASFALLIASPSGYRNYLRRNFLSRRVEVVDAAHQPISPARRAQQP